MAKRAPPPKQPRRAKAPEPATTEPSMPAVGGSTTDPSQPALAPGTEPSMPKVDDPGATDESIVRRADRKVPVRVDRLARRGGRNAPEKKRSPLATLLVLVVLGLGGYGAWKRFGPPPSGPLVPDARNQDVKDAAAAFQDAKNLIRKGQWKQAKVALDELYERMPDLEGLKVYDEAAALEAPLQEHLDAADAAVGKRECARAVSELKAVPDTSKQYFRRNEIDGKLGKLVDEKLKEAQALAVLTGNKDKMRKLKALAEDMLAARPQNRDAQMLLATAERALGAKAVVEAAPDPGDPAVVVMEQYAGGNAAGAFSSAEGCAAASARCAQLKQQIAEVTGVLKKVEALDADELEHVVKLDRSIAGGRLTPLAKSAGVRLAALLYPKASSAAARKQWGYAMTTARKILEGDPNNDGAKGIIADGRAAANELYQRCYVSRAASPEDALPLCKEVIQMLPEGDEIRRKAERILAGGVAE